MSLFKDVALKLTLTWTSGVIALLSSSTRSAAVSSSWRTVKPMTTMRGSSSLVLKFNQVEKSDFLRENSVFVITV